MSITSLFVPATINMTMQKENGTGYTDIKRTHHSLSETAQQNIEKIAFFVAQTSTNTLLQHDDEFDFINSNGTPRSLPKKVQ